MNWEKTISEILKKRGVPQDFTIGVIKKLKEGVEIQVEWGSPPSHSYTIYNSYDRFIRRNNKGDFVLKSISYGDGPDKQEIIETSIVAWYLCKNCHKINT